MVLPAMPVAPIQEATRFASQMTVVHGDTEYNTEEKVGAKVFSAPAGTSILIWQKTVPAQRVYRVGSGSPQFPMNQGFISFGCTDQSHSTPKANLWRDGILRIVATNAANTDVKVIREMHTARLHNLAIAAGASPMVAFPTDRQSLMPLSEMLPDVVEDSIIQLWLLPDGANDGAVADANHCNFILPITIYQ